MKVSIIIPVYNAAPFLDKCVVSALNQQQTGEVLLIDDGSTDGSWEICLNWSQKNNQIRLFKNDGLKGAGGARNVGIRNANCDYVAFLDADDYYLSNRFYEDEKLYKNNSQVVSIASSVITKTYNSKDVTLLNRHYKNNEICGGSSDFSKVTISNLLYESSIKITGITIKREILAELGDFNVQLKQGEDTEFLVRLILKYALYTSKANKPICVRNIHINNTIANFNESIYYRKIVYKKFLKLALFKLGDLDLGYKLLKSYFEIDMYNHLGNKNIKFKKIKKIILSPIIFFRLLFFTKSL